MSWAGYGRTIIGTAAALSLTAALFIYIMDPYMNLPGSVDLTRAPISQNQRFAYPALARNPDFNSLIIGTSTVRLLDPSRLGKSTRSSFANLAMNSATAYEQRRLFELFVRHHPEIRFVVIGIDETWCTTEFNPEKLTFREFPEWLFDENPYNDLLYVLNDKGLENSVRMLEYLRGSREAKYRIDGFRDFTSDFEPRDDLVVKKRLQRFADRQARPERFAPATSAGWSYPLIEELLSMLDKLPETTHTILLFPPLHEKFVARIQGQMDGCKVELRRHTGAERVSIIDYWFASEISVNDKNYWDPVHFTSAVARIVEQDIAAYIDGRSFPSGVAKVID